MKRVVMIAVPVLLLAAGLFGAWMIIEAGNEEPRAEKKEPQAQVTQVRVERVEEQNLQVTVDSRGTVRPRTQSTLAAEISGRIIWKSSDFSAGSFFKKGEVLLKLDPREYEFARTQAEAEIERAELDLTRQREQAAVARREWRELGQGKPTPLAVNIPQVEQAKAALEAARAAREQADLNLERTDIEAPYDGRIREQQADVGQFVNRGAPLASVFAVDYAEIRLPVPDDQAVFLNLPLSYEEGREVDGPAVDLLVTFQGREYHFPARIVRTEGELDPETHVIHAIARVEDPYRRRGNRPPLAIGTFVEAEIKGKWYSDVIPVPRAAFLGDNQVMVVDEESRLRLRKVDVLREQSDHVIVSEGLDAGDRVVVSPLETPVDGMRVSVARGS